MIFAILRKLPFVFLPRRSMRSGCFLRLLFVVSLFLPRPQGKSRELPPSAGAGIVDLKNVCRTYHTVPANAGLTFVLHVSEAYFRASATVFFTSSSSAK